MIIIANSLFSTSEMCVNKEYVSGPDKEYYNHRVINIYEVYQITLTPTVHDLKTPCNVRTTFIHC